MFDWITPYIFGFLSLVFMKTVAEPLAVLAGKCALKKLYSGINDVLEEVWNDFDLEWILKQSINTNMDSVQWLEETIPAKAEEKGLSLPQPVVKILSNYIIKEFDLQKHLDKVKSLDNIL